MIILFSLLTVISLTALIVGLFEPGKVLLGKNPEKKSRKQVFKLYGSTTLISFLFVLAVLPQYDLKRENEKLAASLLLRNLKIDSLNAFIQDLSQNEQYYYQQAVTKRDEGNYKESNALLNELIARFPKSDMIGEVKKLVQANTDYIIEEMLASIEKAHNAGKFKLADENLTQLLESSKNTSFYSRVKKLKSLNDRKLAEYEKEQAKRLKQQREIDSRKGKDLELVSWNWGPTEYGSYVEAKGQVKNIANVNLNNVEVVVSFYDGSGNFITSSSALIEYNPILVGQVSPFSVLETNNPAMRKASIEFKFLMGGTIGTYIK